MTAFILAFLFVFAVAIAVVAVFALPHLRAGSPLLTPKGERVAREAQTRIRRVGKAGSSAVEAVRARVTRPGNQAGAADHTGPGASDGVADAVLGSAEGGEVGPADPVGEAGLADPVGVVMQKQRIEGPVRSSLAVPAPFAQR